jgi:hypothetical protein
MRGQNENIPSCAASGILGSGGHDRQPLSDSADNLVAQFTLPPDPPLSVQKLTPIMFTGSVSGLFDLPVFLTTNIVSISCIGDADTCPLGPSEVFGMYSTAPLVTGDDLNLGAFTSANPRFDLGGTGSCVENVSGVYGPECFPTLTIVPTSLQDTPEMSTGASLAGSLLLSSAFILYNRRRKANLDRAIWKTSVEGSMRKLSARTASKASTGGTMNIDSPPDRDSVLVLSAFFNRLTKSPYTMLDDRKPVQ